MNKTNSKTIGSKIGEALLPAFITSIIVMLIFVAKGIWPFGANRIDYYDNMQQVAPIYTHLWDWLHGDASVYFDWTTGLGTNLSMTISAFSMLSPFNLLLYFIPRNQILEFFSIMTLVKMACMSITMYIFVNKKFETTYGLKVFWSVAYSLCGYSVLYASCFTPWMEALVFLPLLMLAFDTMMKKEKNIPYIIMVALLYIVNYYTATMMLLYVFLVAGAYVFILTPNSKRIRKAWNLGIGTIGGLGLSAFVVLPVFSQLSSSQRGSAGGSLLNQYKNILNATVPMGAMSLFQKWMMIYGASFAIVVIIVGIKKYRRETAKNNFVKAVLFFMLSPLILESIDLVWHFGSYNGYSARFGFLIGFTLMTAGCYYSGKLFAEDAGAGVKKTCVLAGIAAVLCVVMAAVYNALPIQNAYHALAFFAVIFIVLVLFELFLYSKMGKDLNYGTFILLAAVELFIGAYALVGVPKFYDYHPYQYGDYVQAANTVKETLDIEESAIDRIKNPDVSLNSNYPLILNRAGLSSFTAALQSDTQTNTRKWGYSKYFLWLLDSGGTAFSDALLNVTEAVNINALDSNMYTLKNQSGEYKLYDCNFKLPFAMSLGSEITELDMDKSDWITLHNELYTALSDDKEMLVDYMVMSRLQPDDSTYLYKGYIGKQSAVYMNIIDVNNLYTDANCSWLCNAISIYVNDKQIAIPTIGDADNTKYFDDYNNNLICLGTFEDEDIEIKIVYDDPWFLKVSQVSMAKMDLTKLDKLCKQWSDYDANVIASNNTLSFTVKGTYEKDMAIIPVVYNPSWIVKINGQKVDVTQVAGLFTGIQLYKGENNVEMTFVPEGFKAGKIISIGTLLIIIFSMVVVSLVPSKEPNSKGFDIIDLLSAIAQKVFAVIWYAAIVLCFVIPIIYWVIMKIINILGMVFR